MGVLDAGPPRRSPAANPTRIPPEACWEPPQAPLRPARASPQAPPTPVHESPRPTEVPLKPPAPAWPRGFASKRVGSRLLRGPERHGYSGGIFLRRPFASICFTIILSRKSCCEVVWFRDVSGFGPLPIQAIEGKIIVTLTARAGDICLARRRRMRRSPPSATMRTARAEADALREQLERRSSAGGPKQKKPASCCWGLSRGTSARKGARPQAIRLG